MILKHKIKTIFKQSLVIGLSLLNFYCSNSQQANVESLGPPPPEKTSLDPNFDIQGHRGARGLSPENTIPAFIKALDIGVTTLELDLVVSKDKRMIISHEPFFSHEICKNMEGEPIPAEAERNYNIYEYTAEEIQKFDCGSLGHPGFKEQEKQAAPKPTLKAMVQAIEEYIQENNLNKVSYNMETKTTPEGDNIYHPAPQEFVDLLYEELKTLNILDRVYIQSFDVRTLQACKEKDEELPLVLLVYNQDGLEANIQKLGFTPSVYSPFYQILDEKVVKEAKDMGMRVIPWTINEIKDMKKIYKLGVDGIITDYPDRFFKMIENTNK